MSSQTTRPGGEEWGPWVIHNGKGCPVRTGTIVEVVSEDGFGFAMRSISVVSGAEQSSWDWSYYPQLKKIIRYREKKPRGLQILEGQLKELEAPARRSDQPVD